MHRVDRSWLRYWPLLVVLAVSLTVTWLSAAALYGNDISKRRVSFEHDSRMLANSIQRRLEEYETALRAARGLVESSQRVSREEWKRFTDRMQVDSNFPGMLGVSWIVRVERDQMASVEAARRAAGEAWFTVREHPEADLLPEHAAVIVYHEPIARNIGAVGFDVSGHPESRRAMRHAAQTDGVGMSMRMRLLQTESSAWSVVMYLPAFEEGADEPRGWVAAPVDVERFVRGNWPGEWADLTVCLIDGVSHQRDRVIYESAGEAHEHGGDGSRFTHTATIGFGGRTWTLSVGCGPAYLDGAHRTLASVIGVGAVATLLLCGLTWSMLRTHHRAVTLASQMTRSLRDSERRYRSIIEDSGELIFRFGTDMRLTFVNRAVCRYHEATRDEMLGRDALSLIPEEERGFAAATLEQLSPENPTLCYETPALDGRGRRRWHRRTDRAIFDEAGELVEYQSFALDITDRKAAEEALLDSETRFRRLYNDTPFMVHSIDREGRIRDVSDYWLSKMGYERDEVVGRRSVEFLTEASRARAEEVVIPHFFEHGEVWDVPYEMVTKDGEVLEVLMSATAEFDEDERVVRSYAAITDVTERNRAAEALRISRERFDMAVRAANEGLWDWDLRTDEVYFNDTWFEMLGYAPDDLAMSLKTWKRLCHPEDLPRALDAIERYCEGETARYVCEHRLMQKDGSYRWILDIGEAAERDEGGKPTRLIGVHVDIEPQKRAQEELSRQRERAEEANRSKSEFLANMSHEIRTPMTAILGYADLLEEPSLDHETRRAHVATIRRNGEHLLSVLNDILDVSKIEAGKMTVDRVEMSPARAVEEVASLMRVRAESKGLSLETVYSTAVPEFIRSDPVRFRQILVNLVGNALKFTEVGGVTLRVSTEEPSGASSKLRVEVVDTGIGMTGGQVSRLFEAFSQADTSTTRRFGGTGLGLRISKRLAQILGGDIEVESRPGEGSAFRVTVDAGALDGVAMLEEPAFEDAEIGDKPAERRWRRAATATLTGKRVLLAEDGPDNQRLVAHLIRRSGAQVEVAPNGRAALASASASESQGRPFDLILMDMQMPEVDGYEATRLLRERGWGGAIVALTAHAMAGDRDRCVEAGCDDYLSKPIDREALLRVCVQALERHAGAA